MINHLSLQPHVIHTTKGNATSNKFYIKTRDYRIKTIVTRSFNLDYYYFEKNIKKIYADLEKLGLKNTRVSRSSDNPYNPDQISPGVGINLSDLIGLFKRK